MRPTAQAIATRNSAESKEAADVISVLRGRLLGPGCNWKAAVLEAIASWPLAAEPVNGQRLDYLIAGEAFDWRLLAARLAGALGGALQGEAIADWLEDPDPAGGLEEAEFTRLLGVDKYRSHLNYLYGVTVERALLAAAEEEITKRRVAWGAPPSERARDEAYERLYEARLDALWAEFRAEGGGGPRGAGPERNQVSLGDLDAFTYWLFKRRMKRFDPARVASDTRKGLLQLDRMRQANLRRLRARLEEKAVGGSGAGMSNAEEASRVVPRRLRGRRPSRWVVKDDNLTA
jgi:hypothetical protein